MAEYKDMTIKELVDELEKLCLKECHNDDFLNKTLSLKLTALHNLKIGRFT